MTKNQKPAPAARSLRQRIVEATLQSLARTDPVLRIALNRRCSRQAACQRGPFGCACQSREGQLGCAKHPVC